MVGHQEIERLRRLGEHFAGKGIVHVNSTKTGGGVAEILGWMVPLMRELGIDAGWEVIAGPPEFYRVTKAFHNGLAGLARVVCRRAISMLHYEVNRENARGWICTPTSCSCTIRNRSTCRSLRPRAGGPLGVALPHRRLEAEPRDMEALGERRLRVIRRPCSRWRHSRGRSVVRCSSCPLPSTP